MAVEAAHQALATEPEDVDAHCVIALAQVELKKFKEAEAAAGQAIGLAPDLGETHYVMARVLAARNRMKEASHAIKEAISLNPWDPDFHALSAAIAFEQSDWKAALASAEQGLQSDAQHTACGNLRAMSLVKLGRIKEAGMTTDATLAHSPQDSFTHATVGWTRMEERDPTAALESFREAIRLDPENENARAGIVEALKARNPIYGLFLRYFFFMSKLSGQAQMMIIVGAFLLVRFLGNLKASHPEWAGWILGVQLAYFGFVLMSWTAVPLFNLMLRLNPMGKHALTEEQIVEANWIGVIVGLGGASLLAFFVVGEPFLLGAIMIFPMLFPVAGLFRCADGWPKRVMQGITAVLALMAVAGVACMVMSIVGSDDAERWDQRAGELVGTYITFALLSSWAGAFLPTVRVTR